MDEIGIEEAAEQKMWLARDEDGSLCLYIDKPIKKAHIWNTEDQLMEINSNLFPKVQWDDKEPTEVELSISINNRNND